MSLFFFLSLFFSSSISFLPTTFPFTPFSSYFFPSLSLLSSHLPLPPSPPFFPPLPFLSSSLSLPFLSYSFSFLPLSLHLSTSISLSLNYSFIFPFPSPSLLLSFSPFLPHPFLLHLRLTPKEVDLQHGIASLSPLRFDLWKR